MNAADDLDARLATMIRARGESGDTARTMPEESRELDEQRVLVLSHWAGRGKTSAVELGQIRNQAAALFHVDGGRVSELVLYWDRDRALADLGLEG